MPYAARSYRLIVTNALRLLFLYVVITAVSVASVACCSVALLRKVKQGAGKRQEIETISSTMHSSPWFGVEYPLRFLVRYARSVSNTLAWPTSQPSAISPTSGCITKNLVGVRSAKAAHKLLEMCNTLPHFSEPCRCRPAVPTWKDGNFVADAQHGSRTHEPSQRV